MSSFADFLSQSFGQASVGYAEAFLDRFRFPVPEEGEFYSTNPHSGKLSKLLLFAPSHGIAFRFYEPYEVPSHDRVLQPLAKIMTSAKMDIDIVPLVEAGISDSDLKTIKKELEHDSLEWGDYATHNAGYLHLSGQRHAVIIEICESLHRRAFNINFTPKALLSENCEMQSHAFDHLRIMTEGWNDELSFPTHEEAGFFLQSCSKTMNCFSLCDDFKKVRDKGQTLAAMKASELYADRLSVTPQGCYDLAYAATMRYG